MHRGDHAGLGVGEQHRHAVGDPDHQDHAGLGGDQPVGAGLAPVGAVVDDGTSAPCTWCIGTSRAAGCRRATQRLLAPRGPGERVAHDLEVLVHAVGVVVTAPVDRFSEAYGRG